MPWIGQGGMGEVYQAADLESISLWASYFGEPELALNVMERYVNMYLVWATVMREVRQLLRYKEFVREIR